MPVRPRRLLAILVVIAGLALIPAAARAQQRIEQAKREFLDGRAAYERGDYKTAYDKFKQSYILSSQPALLYNIASALQGLGRPGEAAEVLRDYLRAVPDDPERPLVEKRIASLEEAQRLLDRELALARRRDEEERRAREAAAKPQPDAAAAAERARREEELRLERERLTVERERLAVERAAVERTAVARPDPALVFQAQLDRQAREEKRKRRNLAIGLSIGGVLLAGAAVGLALGLTQKSAPPESPFDIGPIPGTQ
jgi:tetratricopeptide (TPR) repeat protein